ncbi:hypothetical protein [Pseudoalteromonas luteoviolacea]|uniref:Uncharacterized protein n=1 Tax=Pseudoalteromonas luteoviolacea S4054 TaxID=1129367 RepID=A0A0F6A7T3_9GAMM|nr:hypothetical protein [Pseudoalteromonas luteoviolacea]AOT11132.1 hypothetical protein S4054249_25195 [Pseudoalteromonas luteoviolacea]AOT15704.1 hypothetical protein S40542_23315 [Pseudoalteromonas luteoviolacea]AOT20953.1 hypothetical protein S4054_25115 [Pseudoalteromonas luteoviolacea]KKE82235.1 hypothetical protein N479_19245 [Pseudoalteromonas luteoviolacea S4054]KZN65432.1 hypothetical protein N481_25085 [Pseudoalteromonas luteoviolacea S4047-1]
MSENKKTWQKQEKAVRATQLAFDLSSEVQKFIKKNAIDEELTPSDMIRRILGLEIKSKKTRQRLSFNLSDEEIGLLAERFDIADGDKRMVKQKVADLLIQHVKNSK